MISQVTGTVTHIDLKFIVVNTGGASGGVGYKIFATGDTISGLTVGTQTSLWTYLAVRDTAMDLYGFPTLAEQNFFELLISVSGIGPKTALGILNVASVRTIETAVQTQDISHLTKVSGIGRKVAEKIVMELKDKIETFTHTPESEKSMRGDADVIEALKALGYRDNEARDALKKLDKSIKDTGMKVKEALKVLGK
jgi:Holliday junction DNA helicase RuvA